MEYLNDTFKENGITGRILKLFWPETYLANSLSDFLNDEEATKTTSFFKSSLIYLFSNYDLASLLYKKQVILLPTLRISFGENLVYLDKKNQLEEYIKELPFKLTGESIFFSKKTILDRFHVTLEDLTQQLTVRFPPVYEYIVRAKELGVFPAGTAQSSIIMRDPYDEDNSYLIHIENKKFPKIKRKEKSTFKIPELIPQFQF